MQYKVCEIVQLISTVSILIVDHCGSEDDSEFYAMTTCTDRKSTTLKSWREKNKKNDEF